MKSGIYKITAPSGGFYVGSAVNIFIRWKQHRSKLKTGKHHSKALQRAFVKYGINNLRFEVILFCDEDCLLFYEQRCLDILRPRYNSAPIAGSQRGLKWNEEAKLARSLIMIGNKNALGSKHSEEVRAKLSTQRKGVPKTLEHRQRISKALKGRPLCLGRKHSKETIEKMKNSAKNRWERRKSA